MKHTLPITFVLLLIFLCSQIIGLVVVNQYIDISQSSAEGKTVINEAAYNITGIAPPPVGNESLSFIYILIAVVIGTVLVLLIIRFRKGNLWKVWFFLSIAITLLIAFAPFVSRLLGPYKSAAFWISFIIAFSIAAIRVYRPNIIVHNFSEVFVYGGIAALFVPILNLVSSLALLVLISIYDFWAVWKSKHMVKMAQFQTENRIFAGLFIPYKPLAAVSGKVPKPDAKTEKTRSAILGGGDIAFPLLFSGVMLKLTADFLPALVISLATTFALALLFFKGKSDRFYPAMPFITAGCLGGLVIVWAMYGFSLEWIVGMLRFG